MHKDKPWILLIVGLLNKDDPMSRVYLTEEQYQAIIKLVKTKAPHVSVNGELIPLNTVALRKNPDYRDPERARQLQEAFKKLDEKLAKKRDKALFEE